MKIQQFFFAFFILGLLIACRSIPDTTNQSPTSTGVAVISTNTPIPTTDALSATAVAQPTIEPTVTATPTDSAVSQPALDIDPHTLARRLIEMAVPAAPEGWQVEPCAGEAAVLCIGDGTENVGYAELLLFRLSGFDADHPLRRAASQLPADPTAYTAEDEAAASQALTTLAEEHLDMIAADRAITMPDQAFVPLDFEPMQMGALPALAFGFVRTNEAEELQERYLNVAAFDRQFIYWFGINYDPANFSTFVSDTAVTRFAPFFYDIAARLPLHQPSLPTLPALILAISLSGYFPEGVSWSLAAELPQAATAVAVLSQSAQIEPLTAEQAAATAQKYGFNKPLYVEYRSDFMLDELVDFGMFVAFDGPRNLALWGRPYTYNDATRQLPLPDLPFTQAAPMQAITVHSVKLVYLRLPAHVSGRADDLYFPVWQFVGTADNDERITIWVTAVLTEFTEPLRP